MSGKLLIRPARVQDTQRVADIFSLAADFMHTNGNPSQWTEGYPGKEQAAEDIERGYCYVACRPDGAVIGVFSLIPSPEPNYSIIYKGGWKDDSPYHVIHRLACAERGKGIASQCMEWCIRQEGHLRADTHRDNIPMHNLLCKHGFEPCGIIFLPDGSERIAYERCDRSGLATE